MQVQTDNLLYLAHSLEKQNYYYNLSLRFTIFFKKNPDYYVNKLVVLFI